MVSPELLRRYPFFGQLEDSHLKAIAMLTEEISLKGNETIFEIESPADYLYFLLDGCVGLYFVVTDRGDPDTRREFFITDVNPGEPFAISALIDPNLHTATVKTHCPSRALRIDAAGLRALCELDSKLAATLMRQLAKAAILRLQETQVQLASARVS